MLTALQVNGGAEKDGVAEVTEDLEKAKVDDKADS